MKIRHVLVSVLVSGCTTLAAFAQASFALQNHNLAAGVNAPVYDWDGVLLTGLGWRVELYGGTEANSLSPLWEIALGRREIIPFSQPGYFWSYEGSLSVLSAPPYGWAWLQVRVWDVGVGPTYEEAVARGLGGYGASSLFYAQGGYPGPLNPSSPAPLIGLQSFSVLRIVPEPSAWLLLVFGLGGLLWSVRRRKGSFPQRE